MMAASDSVQRIYEAAEGTTATGVFAVCASEHDCIQRCV